MHIHVHRYSDPVAMGWAGWIEPSDKSWIAFIDLKGQPRFYLHRDPETGAVLSDDAKVREEQLRVVHDIPDASPGGPSMKPPAPEQV